MSYRLNLDGLRRDFKFGSGSNIHNVRSKLDILPYTTKKAVDPNFPKVLGEFSRLISKKKLERNVEIELLMEKILDKVEFSGQIDRGELYQLVKTLFFDEDELYLFHPQIMQYIKSDTDSNKVAEFLYDILVDDCETKEIELIEANSNVITNLLLESLPSLRTRNSRKKEYANLVPNVKVMFCNDIKWLQENPRYYVKYMDKMLRFYYFFYVSQFVLRCAEIHTAEQTTQSNFFILEWERYSGSRVSYEKGWKRLSRYFDQIFAHVNTLKVLNCTVEVDGEFYGYPELFSKMRTLKEEDRKDLLDDIEKFTNEYKKNVEHELEFSVLDSNKYSSTDDVERKVHYLFRIIHHYLKNKRKDEDRAYNVWFEVFCKSNFLKHGGQWGQALKLSADYLLFLTRLILKNQPKMRLKELFEEFKLRGVEFDRLTKEEIIAYFEKLNILEKKSDSGDALYVKTFL